MISITLILRKSQNFAFCTLEQHFTRHLVETVKQSFCTVVKTTVWFYHGIWDKSLPLPTASSKMWHKRCLMPEIASKALWFNETAPRVPVLSPSFALAHFFLCWHGWPALLVLVNFNILSDESGVVATSLKWSQHLIHISMPCPLSRMQ